MLNFCIKDKQTILFIGDSITDCGRSTTDIPLGNGYVKLFSEIVTAYYPKRHITYINKGMDANCITELKERWENDVISYKPDWLLIAIGINGLHRFLRDPATGVSPHLYKETYDFLLRTAKKKLNCQIILMDPFYISKNGSGKTFRNEVLGLLPQYLKVVREMLRRYKTRHVELHHAFQIQLRYREADVFCSEPVHPNHIGHLIIAMELFKTLCR